MTRIKRRHAVAFTAATAIAGLTACDPTEVAQWVNDHDGVAWVAPTGAAGSNGWFYYSLGCWNGQLTTRYSSWVNINDIQTPYRGPNGEAVVVVNCAPGEWASQGTLVMRR